MFCLFLAFTSTLQFGLQFSGLLGFFFLLVLESDIVFVKVLLLLLGGLKAS